MELGGFAETPETIDATREEFEAFNYCLACDYLNAMIEEDFELLGEVGFDTLESVEYWLDYDGKIGEDIRDQISSISNGHLITINDRPLYEAVIENDNSNFAEIFIYNGNFDVRLFLTVITREPSGERNTLLNVICTHRATEIDLPAYTTFLMDLFASLEKKYVSLETREKKIAFLNQIRPYIAGIRIPSEFKNDIHLMQIVKMNTYSWQKALRLNK